MRIILLLFCFMIPLFGQQFSKINTGPVVSDGGDSRSVNWIDYDNDNDLDLFITNGPSGGENNFFYENDNGSFIKIENIAITKDMSPSDGSTWGDFNNDGFADLFVANWYGEDNKLYINRGDKTFFAVTDTSSTNGGFSESASWADFNDDGFLDLVVANSSGDLNNFVYKNRRNEKFNRITNINISTDGGSSRHMDWADYDNDGHKDLFVANENNQKNFLYHNNGDSTFTRINEGAIANDNSASFGSSWVDYDNDGDWDLFVANWNNQNNALYQNNGDGTFQKLSAVNIVQDSGFSIGSAWADVDNDGDIDLFVANGFASVETDNFLYLNNGDGSFTKDTSSVSRDGGWSYGASFGDYNRDGFLDLAVAKCFAASENNALFLNNGNSNNWVALKLSGHVSNESAIGAVVRLKATINGKETWQMRQVSGQDGYCGQNLEMHFGLGDASQVDSLIIEWPSGQSQHLANVALNQLLHVEESIPSGFFRPHFKADRHVGFGRQTINFTDLTVSDQANPHHSWQWDFDNDGMVDSEEQNPSWQYDTLGVYSVRLTVSNSLQEKTLLFNDYLIIQRVPGFPVIESFFPLSLDTTILKREQVQFLVNASDTSDYPISFSWYLNGQLKSIDSVYDYRASSFNVPRIDSVMTRMSNGYNNTDILWQIHVVDEITFLDDDKKNTLTFSLHNNYPNPFNPSTTIRYSTASGSHVRISIFDAAGRFIESPVNEVHPPGNHSFVYDAGQLASGIYYLKMKAASYSGVKRILLIK